MGYFRVINDTPGERGWDGFDGDELKLALIEFLNTLRSDRKVSLEYVGEEFEEE